MRFFFLDTRILGSLLICLFLSACIPRKAYQIGEENSISYQYYQGCMGLADLGKQFIGSIRSANRGETEDVCGCQAELIFQQGLYVTQPPNDQEFKNCFDGVIDNLSSKKPEDLMKSEDSKTMLSNGISPLLISILAGIPIILLLFLLWSKNESED